MLQKENWKLGKRASWMAFAIFTAIAMFPSVGTAQQRGEKSGRLNRAFEKAAAEFNVPSELLKAIAYSQSHFDNHDGEPSMENGYGVMHLADNNENQTLNRAAIILGVSVNRLKNDDSQNIRGGAAILREFAAQENLTADDASNLAAWYSVVALYSNSKNPALAKFYANTVYDLLQKGFSGTASKGEEIIVAAIDVEPKRGKYEWVTSIDAEPSSLGDYGPALWVPANSGNYTVSNRTSSYPINYVVIHTVQGSYSSAINWFQNPAANVSAHYVIRSSDGQVTQMVREKDVAYHAGNWTYNTQSVGIEHEGYVNNPSWYTDAMYRASAALTRNVCVRYGIPMTRSRIIGHSEVPGATHTDPGPNWNWTYYMQLVTGSSSWETIIDNSTSGRFSASSNWATSSYSSQKYGANYYYANPQPVSDAAWFSANIPSAGNYEVFVWYPANSGYSSSTPFVVSTAGGNAYVYVNQQINGGRWVSIGTHSLNAGDYNVVGVSRWTSASGYVIADAVKIVKR